MQIVFWKEGIIDKKIEIEIGKWEKFYLKCKITLYTMYLPEFKTIHYVILFISSNRRVKGVGINS